MNCNLYLSSINIILVHTLSICLLNMATDLYTVFNLRLKYCIYQFILYTGITNKNRRTTLLVKIGKEEWYQSLGHIMFELHSFDKLLSRAIIHL